MFTYLLLLSLGDVISLGAWRTFFNNYAIDIVHLESLQVGFIQSVREIPGLLALTVVYYLRFFREDRFATWSVILNALGLVLTGFFPTFTGLMLTTLLMSYGFHNFETCNQSLSLQYFSKKEAPFLIAKIRKYTALMSVVTAAAIFLFSKLLSFKLLYLGFGVLAMILALSTLRLDPRDPLLPRQTHKMVLRRRYMNYYILTFLSGARRQVFVVFAGMLLVERFHYTLSTMSLLFVVNNLVNYLVLPWVARVIDRYGERTILLTECLSTFVIFSAYATVGHPWMVALLFVADSVFFNFAIGLRTYFQKIADFADIAPSAGVTFTINHIVAVFVPFAGGALWQINPQWTFFAAAAVALVSVIFALRIPQQLTASPAPAFRSADQSPCK